MVKVLVICLTMLHNKIFSPNYYSTPSNFEQMSATGMLKSRFTRDLIIATALGGIATVYYQTQVRAKDIARREAYYNSLKEE